MSPENENENEEQESSSIPAPESDAQAQGFDASESESAEEVEDDQEESEEQIILNDLKNRAKQLGIKHHPSIGVDKLREKIQEALASGNTQVEKPALSKDDIGRATKKAEALKMIRVNIGCLDPLKKAHQGDWFITGNSVIGTVKRFVPFNVDWHVPQIILNMIREKEFLSITTAKDDKGFEIINKRLTKTYTVSVLEPLTEQELKELAQRQALARGEAA